MEKKVEVNSEECIGCGACVAICPELFEFGEDGKSYVKKQTENEGEMECAKEAKEACPVMAINIT